MPTLQEIHVNDIIQSDAALTPTSGDKLFDKIVESVDSGIKVVVDFSKINYITSAFLNAAIGQLYDKYDSDKLNSFIQFANISGPDVILLKKVINRAKEYFRDKKRLDTRNRNFLNE